MDLCLLILASVMTTVSGNTTSSDTTGNNIILPTTTVIPPTNLITTISLPTTLPTTTVIPPTNLTTTTNLITTLPTTTVIPPTNLTTTTNLITTLPTTTVIPPTNLTTTTNLITTLPATTNLPTTLPTTTNLTTDLPTTTTTTTNLPTTLPTNTTTTVVIATNLPTTLPTTTTTVIVATNLTTTLPTTTTTTVVTATNLSSTTTTIVVAAANLTTAIMTNTTLTLLCQNGGQQTNGMCICPDEFTGQFCEKSNICHETTVYNFTFPKTLLGQAGYSKDECPSGSINAGFPKATAWCLNETRTFSPPQELKCDLTLDIIDAALSSSSSVTRLNLASSSQILTSKPEKLTPQNISTAVKIVNCLLAHTESTQDIHLASITTVSQLLSANAEQFYDVTGSISSLTKTLQRFSLMQVDNGSLLVQPNIAIHSVTVSQSSEIQMTVFSALNNRIQRTALAESRPPDSLSDNRIKINNTFATHQLPIDVQIDVKLPQDTEGTKIGFVLYNNDQFFRSQAFQPSLNLNRRVISGHLEEDKTLEYVQFMMRTQISSSIHLHDFACVIWEYKKQDWSTEGCKKIWNAANQACKCEGDMKLANFAMLMSYRSNPQISQALGQVSIIGCAASVVGLIITAIFQILTRKSRRSSPTILLVSICVCMVIVYLLFIFGIHNLTHESSANLSVENVIPASDFYLEPDHGPCTAFAVLLHYFLLATFTWSALYAAHIFLLIKNTISGPPRYFTSLSLVLGWGLPAVVVGISLGITYRIQNPLNYRQEALCWLAAGDQQNGLDVTKPMLWGFLLPVAVMLLFNIAVLLYFSYTTCRTNPDLNSSQVTPLRNKMLGCISMAVVLGVSWIIGYFLLLEQNTIMQNILSFAFCLFNTTQGIQIFILFTLRTSVFKQKALALLNSIPSSGLARHSQSFDLWVREEVDYEESYKYYNV
ncbi:adhesion G-protein coupled receptor G7 [Hemibagrus wyckioides]|uniref:adhesion G-protein coupled receptor G7 n=1 Tax=Hemibagrus wyckioides TaxID=337641 RepID=UPI00266BAE01|nr:adhesion G-protein coupled receptor G7 [Hemibagrus wyckioides]XP_058237553.1 adhesion G-protein coupled receptor G7 [Hemibagrus wyckioides]